MLQIVYEVRAIEVSRIEVRELNKQVPRPESQYVDEQAAKTVTSIKTHIYTNGYQEADNLFPNSSVVYIVQKQNYAPPAPQAALAEHSHGRWNADPWWQNDSGSLAVGCCLNPLKKQIQH